MSEANKALVVRYFDELWNQHNYDVVDELAVEEDPAGFKEFARGLNGAFTEAHLTCGEPIAEGDRVALPWSVKGTLAGPIDGVGAPGEAVEYEGVALFRVVAGKIVGDGAYTEGFGSVALGQLYDGLKRT
jgi:predicted ester cyclase